ncbi:S-layer homology domain-containing protein [Caldalkalibacillus mannanilyticus]|uniref:S-layer homology domain-containing protein n=1 Tax=Caldalkalibacillus mannanilyticus TaxID=1418 RepID=UPI00046AB1A7|nr:S-layer homology domain-containing protein [Caldalkalibacillus mannanilyticus]
MQGHFTRRLVASTLSLLLLFLSSPFALANSVVAEPVPMPKPIEEEVPVEEGALQKEEAIKLAESLIPVPKGYKLESVYYSKSTYWEPLGSWRLEYVKKEGQEWLGTTSYTINAKTGELMQYSSYDYSEKEPEFPPKVAKEDAQKIAQAFIEKMASEKAKHVMLDPTIAESELPIIDSRQNYYFHFVRSHNGIPFANNGIYVEVTTEGKVSSFHLNWSENVVFPKEKVQVSFQEATDSFREIGKNQINLEYINPWNSLHEEMFLAYQWNHYVSNGAAFVDAISGKLLNYSLEEVTSSKTEFDKVSETKLDPHFKNRSTELTEKEAQEHLWKITGLKADDFVLEHSSFYSGEDGRNSWSFSYAPKVNKEGEYRRLHVNIDALTGQFTEFSNEDYRYYERSEKEVKSSFTNEELVKKAKEGFKKFSPNTAHEAVMIKTMEPMHYIENSKVAYFSFTRLVNGVIDTSFNASIVIDRETGDIVGFYQYTNSNKKYPSTDNVISKEDALEKIFSQYQVVLQYQAVYPEYFYDKPKTENSTVAAKLVYQLRPPAYQEPVFLNAKTGEWHSQHSGEMIRLDRVAPTDIEKHWAKDALMLMYNYRAIDTDENGKLEPNAKIKRGEMIKMLILAVNQGRFYGYYGKERSASFADVGHKSEYFQYVEAAVDMNLLDRKSSSNFNPDEILTREEMAVLVAKALGYNKIAKYSDMFNLDVKDVKDIQNKGHVAIVTHLGIMSAQNEQFLPEKAMTRAEAATVFYRYLQKRAEVTETPIFHPYYY